MIYIVMAIMLFFILRYGSLNAKVVCFALFVLVAMIYPRAMGLLLCTLLFMGFAYMLMSVFIETTRDEEAL